jgi:hypothetical protein
MSDIIENADATVADIAIVEEAPKVEQEIKVEGSGFKDLLSEDIRGLKDLEKFSDVNELAKSYVNLNKLLGKKFTDLSPDELSSYYTKLGKPASKDEYVLPEDPAIDGIKDWYKDVALKANLTNEQAKIVIEDYVALERSCNEERIKAIEIQQKDVIEELKKDFGSAFEQRIEIAKQAVKQFGGDDIVNILNETGLGNNPKVIKMFAEIGKSLQEDKIISSDKAEKFGLTPADAKNKINMLKKDEEFMKSYFNATHPKHRQSIDEMQRLYALMV